MTGGEEDRERPGRGERRSRQPRFARYRPTEREIQGRHFWAVPEGGLCLSAFLILTAASTPEKVLLGRPNAQAPWESMATLEPSHLATIGKRWILPASHLQEFESPAAAGQRIAVEQLAWSRPVLTGPEVFSETYPSAIDPEAGTHWDVHFIFRGQWPEGAAELPEAWSELALLDPRTLARRDVARGHADILSLAGFAVRE